RLRQDCCDYQELTPPPANVQLCLKPQFVLAVLGLLRAEGPRAGRGAPVRSAIKPRTPYKIIMRCHHSKLLKLNTRPAHRRFNVSAELVASGTKLTEPR